MGASSDTPKSQATKLEAKTRRKSAGASARPRKSARRGKSSGPGKLWLIVTGVALASAGVGYVLNDPAKASGLAGDWGKRVNAAGNALAGKSVSPAATATARTAAPIPKPAAVSTPAAAAPAPKALPTAKPAVAAVAPKPAAPAPDSWSAAHEKDLFNALGRQDHETFRKLTDAHQDRLPVEAGVDQDILSAAVARGKLGDVRFMLGSGVSADRIISSPAKAPYLALVENGTFADAAKSEKNITLLMVAAARGDAAMITHLQGQGARNRSTTPRKFTALDFAVASGKAEAIQACLGRKPGDESTRILVSLKERTATFFTDGRIQQRSWISSGRDGHPTPTGRFVITQKHKDWISTKYHVKMPYFLRLNNGAIGLHAGHVPPYPASHGCIRLPDDQARTFFQLADIGTIVDIVN
jgi:hypothetical protein